MVVNGVLNNLPGCIRFVTQMLNNELLYFENNYWFEKTSMFCCYGNRIMLATIYGRVCFPHPSRCG